MNYQHIYNCIINNAKIRNIKFNYSELHHIIPKCLGGKDKDDNLVNLTLREHYICHKLLCEIYPDNKSLAHAYWIMTISTLGALENFQNNNLMRKDGTIQRRVQAFKNGEKITITSREYDFCRKHFQTLAKGIKRNEEQRKRISEATKLAMRRPDRIKKCKANKGSRWYRNIQTGEVYKWFPGDPDIDLSKYQWGRGPLTKEQKAKLSKTQLLEKTICQIGDTNYRYCWYKDFVKTIPEIFVNLNQKQCNSLKGVSLKIYEALSILKEQNIFINDFIIFSPQGYSNLRIVTPAVYELCLNEIKTKNIENIAWSIYNNLDKIKELNQKYLNI